MSLCSCLMVPTSYQICRNFFGYSDTTIFENICFPIQKKCYLSSESNVAFIQSSQPKILRTTANAPQFVSNHTLHADLNISYVSDAINERINLYTPNVIYS